MSYIRYIQLYTRASQRKHNNHKLVKRGSKNNYWLHSLQIKDKLDIYDGRGDKCWHIGTIKKISNIDNKQTKLFIRYDGWQSRYDEWVYIDHSKSASTKLKKLNTITPYHEYLNNSSLAPCKWSKTSEWKKCVACNKKCCIKCSFFSILKNKVDDLDHNKCKTCMNTVSYHSLFNSIYSSIYDEYEIDINIIYLLTDYSLGITIQCSNTKKSCFNDINFESQYELEMNLYHNVSFGRTRIYQYCPKYVNEGTVEIYGKNRRIFCPQCSKNDVKYCSKCHYTSKEATTHNRSICHNHLFIECVVCRKSFDEFKSDGSQNMFDCNFCGNKHCKDCIKHRCIKCQECSFGRNVMQCGRCNCNVCDYCMKKCSSCSRPKCHQCIRTACECVGCADFMCNYNVCDMKDLKECPFCGNNSVCEHDRCHECPILDEWTIYDDEYDDYTLNDDFINKYCYNSRTYKMERKLNGFERNSNLQKYYQRKQRKKTYRDKANKYCTFD